MNSFCLTFQYHGRFEGIDFWFDPACPVIQDAVTQTIAGPSEATTILKKDEKRLLYVGSSREQIRFVIKINLLPRFKDRLRARRFAPDECRCHLRIAHSQLPVPRLWGYFHQKGFALPVRNGLIVAYLEGARNLTVEENLVAVPLVLALYEKGINHPDFMRNNIMVCPPDKRAFLIDLERCSFVEARDFRLVLMNLARYIEYNELPFEHPGNQLLINTTYAALSAPPVSRAVFHELLAMLNSRHLSTRERVGLILPADVLANLRSAVKS